MSDRPLLGLLLGLLAAGAPLHAQERERLLRREAELTARLALLETRRAADDSLRFLEQRRAVVSAGAFHVAYPEWAADEARRRLPALVEERRRQYGVAVDSLLRDTLYVWVDDRVGRGEAIWSDLEWWMGSLHGTGTIARQGEMRSDWVTWVASRAFEQWAQSLIDPEFARWLGTPDLGMELPDQRDGTVRELILAPSARGRRCLDGSIEECRLLLELEAVPDPLLQGYDTADYRGLVARTRSNDAPGKARCVAGMDVGACTAILQRPDRRPSRATSGRIRQSLLTFAVERGGEVAWLRMARAAGRPVADQLASVSGVPIDRLLAEWQQDLRAGHRTTEAGLGSAFLMVLAWSIVGSLFFAWRYRWRHV